MARAKKLGFKSKKKGGGFVRKAVKVGKKIYGGVRKAKKLYKAGKYVGEQVSQFMG
jgi:hypothetical protein